MDDLLLKKMAQTILAHYGQIWIDRRLVADIATLAAKIRNGEKVTVAEVDLVLAELDEVPGFKECQSRSLLSKCLN